jgi:hypothetical protein
LTTEIYIFQEDFMKTTNFFIIFVISLFILGSCDTQKEESVVEVVARDFNFVVADEISSGWKTFKFTNTGHAEHFFLLDLLPDSITFNQFITDVGHQFDKVFDSIKAGKSREEAIGMLVERIPQWYFTSVKQMGGTGIISPGESTTVTLKLIPGNYVIECYIKEKGVFHTALGMARPIKVTEEKSSLTPPKENYEITLSNFKYETEGELKAGENTIAVHFKEHPDAGLGNDVHLVRLEEDTNIDDVIYWMDWMNIKGLESPAPVKFLGGAQEMPVGYTSYFTVNLDPGNYAWIAESSAARGMVELFTVE